jgi:glycosyltransferase involved in cell wall biosynthesis
VINKKWEIQMPPLVSVLAITYNNAPNIRRCIEGVLMQHTSFPFELVIGEDYSTDGTREIVLAYALGNPQFIRVVSSSSKVGERENLRRTSEACQGDFIALCKGDDYWIDPLKLQKQYDAIKNHDAVMVTHSSIQLIDPGNNIIQSEVSHPQAESGFLETDGIILNAYPFYLSSLFIRTKVFKELPDWFWQAPRMDYSLKILCASRGKVFFIHDIMTLLNKEILGPWTDARSDDEIVANNRPDSLEKRSLEVLTAFDKHTELKFTQAVRQQIQYRLEKYFNTYGNFDFLVISKFHKTFIRLFKHLTWIIPSQQRSVLIHRMIKQAWEISQSTPKVRKTQHQKEE